MIPSSIPNFEMNELQRRCANRFALLRSQICENFTRLERTFTSKGETPGEFTSRSWPYVGSGDKGKGGGCSFSIRGNVFEKAGVNLSVISGVFSEEFAKQIPGAQENDGVFFATGISLVAHMRSPLVPAVHMNVRFIQTARSWFGGGSDLTPSCPFEDDTLLFHAKLREACDRFDPGYYPAFKSRCDDYFFLPHRGEARGVGGIFFDYFRTENDDDDLLFAAGVVEAFNEAFTAIVEKRALGTWTDAQEQAMLLKRGRYVEFNLLHDRGTKFGLATGGDTEAILMSMPPRAAW